MSFQKLLIANRGEIAQFALRRAASETGLESVAIYPAGRTLPLSPACPQAPIRPHEIPGRGARALISTSRP